MIMIQNQYDYYSQQIMEVRMVVGFVTHVTSIAVTKIIIIMC